MITMRTVRICVSVPAALLLAVLAGCATSAGTPPASETPRCVMQEVLVCYDRIPSRLGDSDSDKLCHCENLY